MGLTLDPGQPWEPDRTRAPAWAPQPAAASSPSPGALGQQDQWSPAGLSEQRSAFADPLIEKAFRSIFWDSDKPLFLQLAASQQEQYGRVLDVFEAADSLEKGTMEGYLSALLQSGKLLDRDRSGRTVLDHLADLASLPLSQPKSESDPGRYRRDQVRALLRDLHVPEEIHQGSHGTCGVTLAQKELAIHRPGDYAALAAGLLSNSGQGHLPNGAVIRRSPDALEKTPGDSRPALSRVMQASLMNALSPIGYSNQRDSHSLPIPVVGVLSPSGVSGRQLEGLMNAIRSRPVRVLPVESLATVLDGGGVMGVRDEHVREAVQTDLARQREREGGKRPPMVPVALKWQNGVPLSFKDGRPSFGYHWINVIAIRDGWAYFHNPHGNQFEHYRWDHSKTPPVPRKETFIPGFGKYVQVALEGGPQRALVFSSGVQAIPVQDLQDRIILALVDPEVAHSQLRRPENRFSPPF